jgi:actin-related protein
MFESFQCPAMYISIQGILSLHSYGLVTGVAVDCGADVTQIAPIIDGYSIPNASSCLPLGGQDLNYYLLKLLAENGVTFAAKHCVQDACKIKERFCYVARNFDKELKMASKSGLRRTYTLPDNRTITIGSEQFYCPEALFQPNVLGRNFDGIHKICCDNIMQSNQPDEVTKDLFSNIVLSGGSSMFPGLPDRFSREINMLTPSHVHPNVLVVESRQNNVWIGGSIVASLSAFQEMWLTRQDYEENGPSYIHKKCI